MNFLITPICVQTNNQTISRVHWDVDPGLVDIVPVGVQAALETIVLFSHNLKSEGHNLKSGQVRLIKTRKEILTSTSFILF